MKQKVNKFLGYLPKGKAKLILFLLVFFCLFSPFYYVRAGWVQDLWVAIATIPLAFVFLIAGFITIFWSAFTGLILNWVIGPNFISLSYTNPARNPIIDAGLNITQGFVNMFLVLILTYIALATILRLAGHETKKLLIKFIIVALLVNFAPVICGLVVDAANIVMNFFLRELAGLDTFTSSVRTRGEELLSRFNWQGFSSSGRSLETLFSIIGIAVFNFFLGFILIIFAALFVFRHIVIWVLVILSPLAFACYILPATKKYFDQWWQQLLSWSFIGVTAGFFLYLGFRLVMIAPSEFTPPSTGYGSIFDAMIPFWISLAFLFIGLIFGLQTSAMGASAIINTVKKGEKASTKWVARKTGKKLKELAEDKLRTREAAARVTKGWEKMPVLKWYRPEALRRYGEVKPAIESAEKEVTGSSEVEMERVAKGTYRGVRAAAVLHNVAKTRGDSQDVIKAYAKKHGHYDYEKNEVREEELFKDEKFLQDKTLIRALEFNKEAGELGKLRRIDPRLALIGKSEKEGLREMSKTIVDIKPADTSNMEREVPENLEVMERFLAFKDEALFRSLGGLKGGVAARQKTINAVFSKFVDDAKLDTKKNKENWKLFEEYLSKKHNVLTPGISRALGSNRFRQAGWGYEEKGELLGARYETKEKREEKLGESPFAAAGVGAVPPPPPRPPSPPGAPKGGPKKPPPGAPKGGPKKPPPGASKR